MRKPAMKRKPEGAGIDLVIAVGGGPPAKKKENEMDREYGEKKGGDRMSMCENRIKMLEDRLKQIESSMYEDYEDDDDFEDDYEYENEGDEDYLP